MGYYFAMCKSDLNDFFSSTGSTNGLIDVAIGVTIKTFSCRIVKEHENTISSTVTLEIDQNIDKETSCRILILIPKYYPIGDKIKVHLVNYMDEAYIESDYNNYRKNKVKHRYYFALDKEQQKKFIKWTGNVDERKNHIIMMNWANADRDLFTVTHIKDDHLKDYNVYYIMINSEQFHTSKDFCGGYPKQVYKSFVDEEFDTINFFTTIDAVYSYINELKHNDIEMPWSRSCVNVKQAFGTSIENKSLKSLKSLYPHTDHWLDRYVNECPVYPPINTYVKYNENEVKFAYDLYKEKTMTIKDIKINGPATIIFWADNTKTIVKCQHGEQNDPEKGVIMEKTQ